MDELCHGLHQPVGLPGVAAAPGVAGAARVDHHVHIIQRAVFHILEGHELHVHRQAGQGLIDVNQVVLVRLMEVAGQRPGPQLAPGVHHSHPAGQGVGRAVAVHLHNAAELDGHVLDGVVELGEIEGQVQVAAQADAVHRLAQQRPADVLPVLQGIPGRIAAGREGGRAAQPHREQVGVEAQLMHGHLGVGAQPALEAGEHALDQPVEAHLPEPGSVGLQAHPAVVVEDVGFLAVLMDDVHQRLRLFRHKVLDELHVIPLVGGRGHVGHLELAAVDEVLRRQGVAVPLLKSPQGRRADGEVIAGPVGEAVAQAIVRAPDPHEVIEQAGQADHVGLGIGHAPVFHPVLEVRPRRRMPGIQLAQMLAGPGVGGVVIHVDLFPDAPGQEGHGVLMPGRGAGDGDLAISIGPLPAGHLRIAGAVIHLIIGQGVGAIVELELLVEVAVHQADGEGVALGGHRIGDEEGLLLGVGMGLGKLVMLADDADGGINAVARVGNLTGELGAVAVADHVRAPLLRQLQRQLLIARLARQGKAALAVFRFAHGSHSLHR